MKQTHFLGYFIADKDQTPFLYVIKCHRYLNCYHTDVKRASKILDRLNAMCAEKEENTGVNYQFSMAISKDHITFRCSNRGQILAEIEDWYIEAAKIVDALSVLEGLGD